jgi:hypothetical protein
VIIRQQDAGFCDAVDAMHLLSALIEDEMPIFFLLIGEDFEQDQIANDGVVKLCVIERLVLVSTGSE